LAGISLGLLAIKPHFWLLIPLWLLIQKEWKPLIANLATVFLLVFASTLYFGIEAWIAYLNVATAAYKEVLSLYWHPALLRWPTFFSFFRLLGVGAGCALALHLLIGVSAFA